MKESIVLITIDCLRADHLHSYGYNKETSPQMDNIARNGVMFELAFTVSCGTPSAFAPLFTSQYPLSGNGFLPLPSEKKTIAEVLKRKGLLTAAFNNNPYLGKEFNFHRGFIDFHPLFKDPSGIARLFNKASNSLDHRKMKKLSEFNKKIRCLIDNDLRPFIPAMEVTNAVESWLADKDGFFAWVHYMDVHQPYYPQNRILEKMGMKPMSRIEPFELENLVRNEPANIPKQKIDRMLEIYDHEIRYVDEEVGRLVKWIRKNKPNTFVIIMADHGEEFLEHGNLSHHPKLYDELLHIPLIIIGPGLPKGKKIDEIVSNIDIAPTILDMLGKEMEKDFVGKSLKPLIFDKEQKREKGIIIEVELLDKQIKDRKLGNRLWGYRTKRWKYIRNHNGKWCELYDLEKDLGEKKNIAGTQSKIETGFNRILDKHIHQKDDKSERSNLKKAITQFSIGRI